MEFMVYSENHHEEVITHWLYRTSSLYVLPKGKTKEAQNTMRYGATKGGTHYLRHIAIKEA